MNDRDTNWREQPRDIYLRPDAKLYLRPDPKLYLRHDAYRFLRPQLRSPVTSGKDPMSDAETASNEQQKHRAALAYRQALLDLKADIAKLRRELVWERIKRAFLRGDYATPLPGKANFNPAQPRWPARSGRISGQWSGAVGTGGPAIDPSAKPGSPKLSDETPENLARLGARYAQNAPTGSGPRSAAKPTDVRLPDGSRVADRYSSTGYLLSPTSDLSRVAEAGRRTGAIYRSLLDNPNSSAGAIVFLGAALYRDLSFGGTFDYQRERNETDGYTFLPQYRNVSNFNVGLYCQQAGLSLDETLTTAGIFARLFSSNADPAAPYGLDRRNREFMELGFRAGQSAKFGPSR
jgi:hypothetical protein